MSLILDNNFRQNPTNTEPFQTLPSEVVIGHIFFRLNFDELRRMCLVSKMWQQLASYSAKSGVYENTITNKKWAQWFGEDIVACEDFKEEWESLPWNIAWILESPCPISLGKRVIDTHMLVRLPKTLNGGLTLKSLGELAKKHFPDNVNGYKFIWSSIMDQLGSESIDQSRWVLMLKNVLPDSTNKSYEVQLKIIADLARKSLISYEVARTLVSATCILAQYFDSNERLFSDKPLIYTRCKEQVDGFQTLVGHFSSEGLDIDDIRPHDHDHIGIAPLWKL